MWYLGGGQATPRIRALAYSCRETPLVRNGRFNLPLFTTYATCAIATDLYSFKFIKSLLLSYLRVVGSGGLITRIVEQKYSNASMAVQNIQCVRHSFVSSIYYQPDHGGPVVKILKIKVLRSMDIGSLK